MKNCNALTVNHAGKLTTVITAIGISEVFQVDGDIPRPAIKTYSGIWDTGATGSVITKRVVDDLGLVPIGKVLVNTAGGQHSQNKYLISVNLPCGVQILGLSVTEAPLAGCDALIGMDVISCGDFAITNHKGKTTMSFRIPSFEKIDFVPAIKQARKIDELKKQRTGNSSKTSSAQKKKKKARKKK